MEVEAEVVAGVLVEHLVPPSVQVLRVGGQLLLLVEQVFCRLPPLLQDEVDPPPHNEKARFLAARHLPVALGETVEDVNYLALGTELLLQAPLDLFQVLARESLFGNGADLLHSVVVLGTLPEGERDGLEELLLLLLAALLLLRVRLL
eukprot:CAMPEP_0168619884 /NCGR_PEP_ID=MMETSP0449_2-20121227/6839_1 /TAXON_ID=1082188 /ORGANISM="Strombidium rassoulzadegani, Strain ras09" /LENGTH=147 /DNA_ID=CAMNT_0008660847 /DNA_START=523 /DNA_END=962 /DNA_ORIENTATION=-